MSITTASGCRNVRVSAGSTQYISSPNYPSRYPSNIDMCWLIEAISRQQRLRLAVINSRLQSASLCQYDYVEIRDGHTNTSPLRVKFCGTTVPSPVRSTGSQLYVRFKTDESDNFSGFRMSITSTSGCRYMHINASTTTQIYSPNYPDEYPNNLDMCWVLQAQEITHKLRLTVHESSIEDSWRCANDYVDIRDGQDSNSPSKVKFCGRNGPRLIKSSSRYMYIRFKTDSSQVSTGFSITVRAVTADGCFVDYVRESADTYIESPFYPSDYPNNLDMCWSIHAPSPTYVVRLIIEHFQIEHGNCPDFVEIRDGMFFVSPLLYKLCGGSQASEIRGSGQHMYIRFKTDLSITDSGFRFAVTALKSDAPHESVPTAVVVGSVFAVITVIVGVIAIIFVTRKQNRSQHQSSLDFSRRPRQPDISVIPNS